MWITDHPYATGGIILVGGILFIMLRGGSSQPAPVAGATVDPSVVGAGMRLQEMQMQVQAHAQDVAAAAQTEANQMAVALAIAKINADQNTLNMNQQTMLAGKTLESQEKLGLMNMSLNASIANAQITTQQQAMQLQHADTQAQIAAQLETQKQNNALMSEITKSNIDLSKQLITSNQTVAIRQIQAQEKASESIWDKIF